MINLNPVTVRKIFANNNDQWEVLISLYKLIFPFWHQIKELKGYPSINTQTWEDISELSISFDRIHHPHVIAGGNWMNRGFSIDNDLPDWTASIQSCTVTIEPKVILEHEENQT